MPTRCEHCGGHDDKWWLVTMKQVGGAVSIYSLCTVCKMKVESFIIAGLHPNEANK